MENANQPARKPLINHHENSEELAERILKRQVPAWAISVALHAVLLGLFIAFDLLIGTKIRKEAVAQTNQEIVTKVEEEEKPFNAENPDPGLDPKLPLAFDVSRRDDLVVPGIVYPEEPIGNMGNGPEQNIPPPPGFVASDGQGGANHSQMPGAGPLGDPGSMNGPPLRPGQGFAGRSAASREANLKREGGSFESEACVARGLIWLSKQQKPDGSWEIDGGHKSKIAGTGFALLPFLAAGYTHKGAPKESFNPADKEKRASKYPGQIDNGIKYLVSKQQATGDFGTNNMYEHAIVTMALCEAYGMTNDQRLKAPAQLAVRYIVNAQHSAGGWRYAPGQAGYTSVTGCHVQALKSAHLAGLAIPKDTLTRSGHYLDSCAGGTTFTGATYGYTGKAGSPSMTAVGLLC